MKQPVYFIHPCRLARKNSTISIEWKWDTDKPFISPASVIGEEIRNEFPFSEEAAWWLRVPTVLPIERMDSLHLLAPVDMNTDLLELLYKKEISVHQYNWAGEYIGSFNGNYATQNGKLLIEQVKLQQSIKKRTSLSKIVLRAAFKNMIRLISYHNRRTSSIPFQTEFINDALTSIKKATTVDELMGIEGSLRKVYYEWLDTLLPESFQLKGRSYRPALNAGNAMVSFINALLYGLIEAEINYTQLSPQIGFLHQPGRDKNPLVYDLSEIFKPVLVDPLLLMLTRKNMISPDDFFETEKGIFIKKEAKLKIVRAFSGKVHTTIYDDQLKRNVSYRSLVRMEAYKLIHLLLDKVAYKPFIQKW